LQRQPCLVEGAQQQPANVVTGANVRDAGQGGQE
jgi:hypothetical protein